MGAVGDERRASRLIGGVLLLLLGGLFVLQNLGYIRAGNLADYWPLLLVWVGLSWMLSRRNHVAAGLVLFLLGVFLQLDRLDVLWFPKRFFWPGLLIAIGLALIADALIGRSVARQRLVSPGEAGSGRRS